MERLRQRLYRHKALPVSLALAMVLGTILGYATFGLAPRTQSPSANAMPADATTVTARTGTMQPGGRTALQTQSQVPVLTAQQKQQLAAGMAREQSLKAAPHGPVAPLNEQALAASRGPAVSAPSASNTGMKVNAGQPLADSDFVVPQANYVNAACPSSCATVLEPSIGNDGKYMWMSANWFDALSTNGGGSFGYVNPGATFNPTGEFFCCDQQALYEPSRDMMVWESLWLGTTSTNPNSLILAFLPGNLSALCWYNWTPDFFGYPTNYLLDYPDVEYSTDYLWMTFNVYNTSGGWVSTVVFKAPLTAQSQCAGFSYSYYTTNANFSFALASGAQGNMYFDSNWYTSSGGTGSAVHICAWGDLFNTVSCLDRSINTWPFITSTQNCGSADGVVTNWCTRLDSRRGTLYLTKANYRGFGPSSLGMAWSAAANPGGGFPFPYIVRNYFNLNGYVYDGSDNLYATWGSVAYPSIAPNSGGFLGASFAWGGGCSGCTDYYPATGVFVDDKYNPTQPWYDYFPVFGAGNATAWGDYNTTRALLPQGYLWLSAGWYVNGTTVEPYEIIFGRANGLGAYNRWSSV